MGILAGFRQRSRPIDLGYQFALVDVETTGLNAQRDRIVQVAVRQLDRFGALEGSWHTLVDPGRDPGPTHIHGITSKMLVGAPNFATIAATVADLIGDRVLVAHYAAFDWDFLQAASVRAGAPLLTKQRLCTWVLARRLDIDLPNLKLGTLATWAHATHQRAHSADDDVLVLQTVFLTLMRQALQAGLTPPLSRNTIKPAMKQRVTRAPGFESVWSRPGPWTPGAQLQQGMKFAISGATLVQRGELYDRAIAVGLIPMNSVSTRSHFLVCTDPRGSSVKIDRARSLSVPVVMEAQFLSLLTSVASGVEIAETPSPPAAVAVAQPIGLLQGFRVLVLGGSHELSARIRDEIAGHGGRVAVNMTMSVTHLVALAGADRDVRWGRTGHLARLDPTSWVVVDGGAPLPEPPYVLPADADSMTRILAMERYPGLTLPPVVESKILRRGEVADLPADMNRWDLFVSWTLTEPPLELDVVAFVTDARDQVLSDQHFVFFNAPESVGGEVSLEIEPGESRVTLNLDELAVPGVRVVVGASLASGRTFGDLGPVELTLRNDIGAPWARAVLDAGTVETSLVLAEFYQRRGDWRIRAVGQGYEDSLAEFATRHGVTVD